MAFSDKTLMAICNAYTDETVLGGGAIKGKNCIIQSITPITGGNRVTFKWTLDDGTVQTQSMDVMDGVAPAGTYVDKDDFDDNFETIPGGNIFDLKDAVITSGNITAVIKDNVITLNGTAGSNNYVYMKISNGTVELAQATGAKAIPDSWAAETTSELESGKQYAFDVFTLGGTINSATAGPGLSLKDSTKTVIQTSGSLFTYTGNGAYFQLLLGKESTFKDFKVACMLTESAVPLQFTTKELCLQAYDEIYKPYVYKISNEENIITIDRSDYDPTSSMYCQGSCTVDGYLYIVFINGGHTYIAKYDLSDYSLVAYEQMDQLHHGNDLTYNPFDGYLYVIDLDSPNVIHKVTTALVYVGSVTLDLTSIYPGYTGVGAIDFNMDRGVFVCLIRGNNKGYAILDPALGFIDLIWSKNHGGTYAGIYSEGDFIYQATASPNMIHVMSFGGRYVGRLFDLGKLSLEAKENYGKYEPESLSIVGDKIYIAYNSLNIGKTYVDAFDISQRLMGLLPKI